MGMPWSRSSAPIGSTECQALASRSRLDASAVRRRGGWITVSATHCAHRSMRSTSTYRGHMPATRSTERIISRSTAHRRANAVLPLLVNPGKVADIPDWLAPISRAQRLRILTLAIGLVSREIDFRMIRISHLRKNKIDGVPIEKRRLNRLKTWLAHLHGTHSESKRLTGRGRPSALSPVLGGRNPDLVTANRRKELADALLAHLRGASSKGMLITSARVSESLGALGVRAAPRSISRVLSRLGLSLAVVRKAVSRKTRETRSVPGLDQLAEVLKNGPADAGYHIGAWQSHSLEAALARYGGLYVEKRSVRRWLRSYAQDFRRSADASTSAGLAPRQRYLADCIDPDVFDRSAWVIPGPERHLSSMTGASLMTHLARSPKSWGEGDGPWTFPVFLGWLQKWWHPTATRAVAKEMWNATRSDNFHKFRRGQQQVKCGSPFSK